MKALGYFVNLAESGFPVREWTTLDGEEMVAMSPVALVISEELREERRAAMP